VSFIDRTSWNKSGPKNSKQKSDELVKEYILLQ